MERAQRGRRRAGGAVGSLSHGLGLGVGHRGLQTAPHQPTLYVVATPIGNTSDWSLRAIEAVFSSSLIVAENRTQTRDMLYRTLRALQTAFPALAERYPLSTSIPPVIRCTDITWEQAVRETNATLASGKSVALVTDAGTPAISDPGARLVRAVVDACRATNARRTASTEAAPVRVRPFPVGRAPPQLRSSRRHRERPSDGIVGSGVVEVGPGAPDDRRAPVRVCPVPGPSAVTTALCIAGIDLTSRFVMEGFAPRAGRERVALLERIGGEEATPLVVLESPKRVRALLEDASACALARGAPPREVVVCRELSKRYEHIVYAPSIDDAAAAIPADPRGEFTIVFGAFRTPHGSSHAKLG